MFSGEQSMSRISILNNAEKLLFITLFNRGFSKE